LKWLLVSLSRCECSEHRSNIGIKLDVNNVVFEKTLKLLTYSGGAAIPEKMRS